MEFLNQLLEDSAEESGPNEFISGTKLKFIGDLRNSVIADEELCQIRLTEPDQVRELVLLMRCDKRPSEGKESSVLTCECV